MQLHVDEGHGNTTGDIYFLRPGVTRAKCNLAENVKSDFHSKYPENEAPRRIREKEDQIEMQTVRLEEDRIFHTCHLLPHDHKK